MSPRVGFVRMREIIERNLPRTKPQLWANLPRAALRMAQLKFMPLVAADWEARPHRVSVTGAGMHMEVFVRDSIGRAIFVYGAYEIPLTRFLRKVLPLGGVFVDVGANAGYHTLVAASAVGPSGSVHSFEPSTALRERLLRHVSLNRLANVTVHGDAVWSGATEVPFYESVDQGNSGVSSVLPGDGRSERAVGVPATTLDRLSREVGQRIDVVKIDVEGGEKDVFSGATALLASDVPPILAFESFDAPGIEKMLREFGFEVGRLSYDPGSGFHIRAAQSQNAKDPFAAYEAPTYIAVKTSATRSLALVAERFRS